MDSQDGYFRSDRDGKPGEWPAFRFDSWQPRKLSSLPSPASGFGLSFINNKEINDAVLKELAGMKTLLGLDLGNTPITDVGMKELGCLVSLQTLNLWGTRVTDVGFKEVAGLKSLRLLDLASSARVGRGPEGIGWLEGASVAELDGHENDERRAQGAGRTKVSREIYRLGGKHLTDAGLTELSELTSLQELELDGKQIGGGGLKGLGALKSLRKLHSPQYASDRRGAQGTNRAQVVTESRSLSAPR